MSGIFKNRGIAQNDGGCFSNGEGGALTTLQTIIKELKNKQKKLLHY